MTPPDSSTQNPTTRQPDSTVDCTRKRVHILSALKARDESSAPKARQDEGTQRRSRAGCGDSCSAPRICLEGACQRPKFSKGRLRRAFGQWGPSARLAISCATLAARDAYRQVGFVSGAAGDQLPVVGSSEISSLTRGSRGRATPQCTRRAGVSHDGAYKPERPVGLSLD